MRLEVYLDTEPCISDQDQSVLVLRYDHQLNQQNMNTLIIDAGLDGHWTSLD